MSTQTYQCSIHKNAKSTSVSHDYQTCSSKIYNVTSKHILHQRLLHRNGRILLAKTYFLKKHVPFVRSSFKQRCSAYESFTKRKTNIPERTFRTRHSQNAEANRPKRAFHARHSQKRRSKPPKTSVSYETLAKNKSKPPKTSVSYETFAKTQKQTAQNERFVRDIRKSAEANL